ncbi:MAG TPA: ABC transporter permease [Thermoanaerobaculia bacterium]|nr:ABC transporter permease [Thermoanaerobaculia bacterium]
MQRTLQSLRQSTRSLRRRPGFSLAVILLVGLAVGATTAVFTVHRALLLKPLPMADLDGVVAIHRTNTAGGNRTGSDPFSYPQIRDYAHRTSTLAEVGPYFWWWVNFSGGEIPERVAGGFASAELFSILHLVPETGRFFRVDETEPSAEQDVAVVSHSAWKRLFGGAPDLVGRSIEVNGHSFEVVGVAPAGFAGVEAGADVQVWVPLPAAKRILSFGQSLEDRAVALVRMIARRKPGVSLGTAQSEVAAISERLAVEHAPTDGNHRAWAIDLAHSFVSPRDRNRLESDVRALYLAVLIVLIAACVNISSLLSVRGEELHRELAVRRALGEPRRGLARRLLAEITVLFALGGALGLPTGLWVLAGLWRIRPPELADAAIELGPGPAVYLFAFLVTAVAGLMSTILPLARATRPDLRSSLASPLPLQQRSRPRGRWGRRALVVMQLALAMTSLLTARLFLGKLETARATRLGFDPTNLLTLTLAPGDQGLDPEASRQFFDGLLERTRALAGVESVALAESRLLRGGVTRYEVYPDTATDPLVNGSALAHRRNIVSPGFFTTARIPLVAGRDFDATDCPNCPGAVIVNRRLAEAAWPGQDPIGHQLHLVAPDRPAVTVVGVAENTVYRDLNEEPAFFLYLPASQQQAISMTLHVRTQGEPSALLPPIREAVLELVPGLPIAQAAPMTTWVDRAMARERGLALFYGAFAALTLVLALVGVYGVMAQTVQTRRQELGIRLALGATPAGILAMILGEVALLAAAGTLGGFALTLGVFRPLLASQLAGVAPLELMGYAWQLALLAAAALIGSWTPAHRASRVPPAISLAAR